MSEIGDVNRNGVIRVIIAMDIVCFVLWIYFQILLFRKIIKTKEKSVVDFVIENFSNFTWIADRRVQDGCSRRRPDLLCDMGSHVIIVEVYENQHDNYDCSCENKRLMEISKDVGHRNIVFIRFNPDKYIDKNGSLVKSCWTLSKTGILKVPAANKFSWDSRLNSLKLQIEYWLKNPSSKMVEIVQLYYDNFWEIGVI